MTSLPRPVIRNVVNGMSALAGHAWRRRSGRAFLALVLCSPLVLHGVAPIEAGLEALRFRVLNREPTGKILLVDIDGPSLRAIGRWPWPRSIHAEIVDRLLQLGAGEIAFDVDFSSASNPDQDAALEEALKRANGTVILAAHKQVVGQDAENRSVMFDTRPLDRFAANAWEASVNVVPDGDERVRWFPEGSLFAKPASDGKQAGSEEPVPALASMLGGGSGQADGRFLNANGFTVSEGFRALGYDVRTFVLGNLETLPLSPESVFVGPIGTVWRALARLGPRSRGEPIALLRGTPP